MSNGGLVCDECGNPNKPAIHHISSPSGGKYVCKDCKDENERKKRERQKDLVNTSL